MIKSINEAPVMYEVRGQVVILTLNRPRALNTVNSSLSGALGAGLARAVAAEDVRVIVLTGSGRSFVQAPISRSLRRAIRCMTRTIRSGASRASSGTGPTSRPLPLSTDSRWAEVLRSPWPVTSLLPPRT